VSPRPHLPAWPALPVFLATLAVYASLVPWTLRVWQRTGDEPHYLLAAHSLVVDRDLDLRNNYDAGDYLSFWNGDAIDRHVVERPGGVQLLSHNAGLAVLLAPAYAVGGHAGVAYLLALIGALVAAEVYALAHALSGDARAAALAWLGVAFTPPVLWYAFQIYPELPGALATIVAVRQLLAAGVRRSTGLGYAATALALAALPFLSGRFVLVWAVLIVAVAVRARRSRSGGWLTVLAAGLVALLAYLGANALAYGSASPAASYQGETAIGVDPAFLFERSARGLLGWLLDMQRGLLWWSPVYVLAFAGLVRLARARSAAVLLVAAPLGVTLAASALWGGFWLAWEMGPRFLVVALPAAGAAMASAWAPLFRRVGAHSLAVALFGVAALAAGLVAAALTVHVPHVALTSALPAVLERRLRQPLTEWLPALGGYAVLEPGHAELGLASLASAADTTISGDGQALFAPAGQAGLFAQWPPVRELPFGWYRLTWLVRAGPAARPGRLASVQLVAPFGAAITTRAVDSGELAADGAYQPVALEFRQGSFDAWSRPLDIAIFTTGRADLWSGGLRVDPDPAHGLGLAALWAVALAALALVLGWPRAAAAPARAGPAPPPVARPAGRGALIAGLALIAIGGPAWQAWPRAVVYGPAHLGATTGRRVPDSEATWGLAQRARGDGAERLGYTALEFYPAGRYRVSARLRAAVDDPAIPLARLRVVAQQVAPAGARREIAAADLPADGAYHEVALEISNPRWQALGFVVDYLGAGEVALDTITVTPLAEPAAP
jgi:hypothetical protein